MKSIAGLITVGIALAATLALAHGGATGIVLERMKGMTAMRDVMRDLAPIIQGAEPYDALAVSEAGYVIAAHSGETMRALFPDDSITGVTFAKQNIWAEWQEFASLADDLRIFGETLAKVAPIGLEVLTTALPVAEQTVMPNPEYQRSQQIADLMGYAAPSKPELALAKPEPLQTASSELGAEAVFAKISGTCSACHARFRKGRN